LSFGWGGLMYICILHHLCIIDCICIICLRDERLLYTLFAMMCYTWSCELVWYAMVRLA
jgi:hypothetical protein